MWEGDINNLDDVGSEEKEMQELLLSLTNEQMLALVEVDSRKLGSMSPEELSEALGKVPGLEEDTVKRILQLDDSLSGQGSGSDATDDKDS